MVSALAVYHGAISKLECEDRLGKMGKDGAYLIRDSETIQAAMCLCVYRQKVVYTYRILQTNTGNYSLQTAPGVEEKLFKTLEELVQHYKHRGQGLAQHLRHLVKRKTLLQLTAPNVIDEEPDYENVDESDYVEVLPS
ncbi:SH2 domain-containing protein 1B2-like [Coregonus clupeaformis]|uniref:SH2 domain-containing protein 1B2-like n=1 Tax=Coregonus clupeaformis TaxID=59861 RepID=UPI001BE10AAF|nr:SH2 domain-containing protein 1B2-like [Coregonus clupeaformis]